MPANLYLTVLNPAVPLGSSIANFVDDHTGQADDGFGNYNNVEKDMDGDDLMLGTATILNRSEKLDLSHTGGEMEEALREAIRRKRQYISCCYLL